MSNEEIIWNYLYDKIKNPYGVAALMGNLFAESSLNPICANGIKKYGLTNIEYTTIVDSGKNENFITDGIAYGLAQWCFKTRKQGLLSLAQQENKSIGNIYLQLDYLWQELQQYKTVLRALLNAKNVKDASDVVLLKYEKPANKSENVKVKRAQFGLRYYDKYARWKIDEKDTELLTIAMNMPQKQVKEIYEKLKEIFK